MITEKQKEARRNFLGSSDVARIMTGDGVRVTLEKMGEIEPANLDDEPSVQLGQLLERPVLDAYCKATGAIIAISPDTIIHPSIPYLGCHLDAAVLGLNRYSRVVEAKNYSVFDRRNWGEPGTDQVPAGRLWQVMQQMAVADVPVADIPICFINETTLRQYIISGTLPIEIYTVPRDEELIAFMLAECAKVWKCVETGVLPEPVKIGDASLIYRHDNGNHVEASDEIGIAHHELMELREHAKLVSEKEKALAEKIKVFMGAAQTLAYRGAVISTWKNDADGERFDEKKFAAEYPHLHKQYMIKKPGPRKFLPKQVNT